MGRFARFRFGFSVFFVLFFASFRVFSAPLWGDISGISVDYVNQGAPIPVKPERVICSGPGALRLCVYLGCQNKVIAVDDMESRRSLYDARPYALANPHFKKLPLFGEYRGQDNPELILSLDPAPQLIIKTFPEMGMSPADLSAKTSLPVLALRYGDLGDRREDFYQALRTLGRVMGVENRAEELIGYIETTIADLRRRTADRGPNATPSCYIGGIALKGAQGLLSTESDYPPFSFLNTHDIVHAPQRKTLVPQQVLMSKEALVAADPQIIFIDVSTLQGGARNNALRDIETDPAYRNLRALRNGAVFGVLPYNWYTYNFESILANAYYIGSVLYPPRFADIDPVKKADEIYRFFVGVPVFDEMNSRFDHTAFARFKLR
jgi:iron complex transport system substrate-binding protein